MKTKFRFLRLLLLFSLSNFVFCHVFDSAQWNKNSSEKDCVILIHGFLRSGKQLESLGKFLDQKGFVIIFADYPSRKYGIEEVAENDILPLIRSNCTNPSRKIHFVTHSAGGIVLRYFLSKHSIGNLGRIVLLAPPNHGSEVANFLCGIPFFRWILGPILSQLKAGPNEFLSGLGNPKFEFGVITGDRSWDPISSTLIPGEDDGKVSVISAQLPTMKDFLLVSRTHTFIMDAPEVQTATFQFLTRGKFESRE